MVSIDEKPQAPLKVKIEDPIKKTYMVNWDEIPKEVTDLTEWIDSLDIPFSKLREKLFQV